MVVSFPFSSKHHSFCDLNRHNWDVRRSYLLCPCIFLINPPGAHSPPSPPKVSVSLSPYHTCLKYLLSATGFSKAFPGIKPHLLTLTNNFHVPLYREVIMSLGISSVSRESCSNILASGPGQAITIVVGGAAESLSARPGTADLTLKRR
jgi:hypothetical protein